MGGIRAAAARYHSHVARWRHEVSACGAPFAVTKLAARYTNSPPPIRRTLVSVAVGGASGSSPISGSRSGATPPPPSRQPEAWSGRWLSALIAARPGAQSPFCSPLSPLGAKWAVPCASPVPLARWPQASTALLPPFMSACKVNRAWPWLSAIDYRPERPDIDDTPAKHGPSQFRTGTRKPT